MKRWILVIGLVVVIIAGLVLYNINNIVKKDTIYKGISIEGIDMTHKTKEEALESLKSLKQAEIEKSKMNLKTEEKEYELGLEDIDFDYDYEKAIESAHDLARDGNLFKRYKKIKEIEKNNKDISIDSS